MGLNDGEEDMSSFLMEDMSSFVAVAVTEFFLFFILPGALVDGRANSEGLQKLVCGTLLLLVLLGANSYSKRAVNGWSTLHLHLHLLLGPLMFLEGLRDFVVPYS
ncbi:hypothetical protein T484DRAFT_1753659 [Baffinella frigidus]|nr:hypothetical protein T484DRAFT_1753659 [Cryptophyta sp. CCMP2293]